MSVLIEELYTSKECETIRDFYNKDESVRGILREAIGTKIILDKDKFLTCRPLDVICLICLTSKFASSDDECHRVAVTLYQFLDKPKNFLPYITEDSGLIFANKVLISLSFCAKALEQRWKRRGAPSPDYYRKASKLTFKRHGQEDIAAHHEQWEGFIGELFV
jgi:hypothetical protein